MLDIDNNFDDAMFYYVCLESKFVANSEKELKEKRWPYATHYISLENESEELQYLKNKRKMKAIARLEAKELSLPKKKEFIWILELASSLTELTEEQVDNLLYRYLEADNGREGGNIDKFNELFDLLQTDKGRQELKARLILRRAIESRIVWEKGDTYTWNRAKGSIVLGERYSDAIEFLMSPKKEVFVDELEAEIKAKNL